MTVNPEIFREYDIRGVADRDLTEDFVRTLGRAMGTYLRRAGCSRISVGRSAISITCAGAITVSQ